MNLSLKLKMAKRKGEAIANEYGFNSFPIEPIKIAENLDIVVQAKPDSADGVSGMLLRHGDNFGILYASHIKSDGFKSFCIAHELGHYFLDGHIDHVLPEDGLHVSNPDFLSKDTYEQEADNFAAGLLMPGKLFKKELRRFEIGLESIEGLQKLCKASLTATAIRYAEISSDTVAIIMASNGIVDYCVMSESFKSFSGLRWLKKGDQVPENSATKTLAIAPNKILSCEREFCEIDIMDWFGGSRSTIAHEEVIGLGSYGKSLTVLSCPQEVDDTYFDPDDMDDETLEENWTPRFHR